MTIERKDLKSHSYTLTSEEIEKLLQADFGSKVQPVNQAKLAKQNRQRDRIRERQ